MPFPDTPARSVEDLVDELRTLRVNRERRKRTAGRKPRSRVPREWRPAIMAKTGGLCHICGGGVSDGAWEADHVLAHSGGGEHGPDNFLPAHRLCNNYRWDYLPEEFQAILKLGVWARTQVEQLTGTGRLIAPAFVAHEKRRAARRKPR